MRTFQQLIDHFLQLSAEEYAGHDDSDSDEPSKQPPHVKAEPFFPSLWDVLRVRYLLQRKLSRRLPEELVDLIIDAAEYWPSVERSMEGSRDIRKDRDKVLLKTVPLCYDRKVCHCHKGLVVLLLT